MSPLLAEFYAATVPVPTLSRDERAVQNLPGMAPDDWVMVTLLRDEKLGVISMVELFVPTDYRGRGFASAALRYVLDLARKHNTTFTSYVQPFGTPGLNKRQLAAWYRRHGFTVRRDYSMYFRP